MRVSVRVRVRVRVRARVRVRVGPAFARVIGAAVLVYYLGSGLGVGLRV